MSDLAFPNEHRRRTHQLPRAVPLEAPVPLDKEIEQSALRFSTMVGNLQRQEREAIAERDTALARLEQAESTNNDLRSQLEGERARTAEAKAEAEQARTARAQLETVITGMVNMGSDALG